MTTPSMPYDISSSTTSIALKRSLGGIRAKKSFKNFRKNLENLGKIKEKAKNFYFPE